MRSELHIDAFEYDKDQQLILENAKHLFLDDAELIEHFSHVNMRFQLSSTNYALDAEREFLKRKFKKFKKECSAFDKMDYKKS